jgi:hypothetical protein
VVVGLTLSVGAEAAAEVEVEAAGRPGGGAVELCAAAASVSIGWRDSTKAKLA